LTTTSSQKAALLSPAYNAHIVRLAQNGSYHFRLAENIYVWFLEGHKIVLIDTVGHILEIPKERFLIEQASCARAQEVYEAKRKKENCNAL
jgi:hypothetical protein